MPHSHLAHTVIRAVALLLVEANEIVGSAVSDEELESGNDQLSARVSKSSGLRVRHDLLGDLGEIAHFGEHIETALRLDSGDGIVTPVILASSHRGHIQSAPRRTFS